MFHHSVLLCLLVHHLNLLTLLLLSLSLSLYFSISLSLYIYIYLGVQKIQEYQKNKRERNQKIINPQEENYRHEEKRKKMRATVRETLVVGYWELVPMESGSENSSEQGIFTVTKDLD